MEKLPAHDKWVCLACRWTAKIPLVDVRSTTRPRYRCPKCRAKMLCTGTAFRPPRKDDNEGWVVVERLLTTGFRFFSTSQRRRVPRTLKELEAWIRAREGPDGWLPERRVRIRRDASRPVLRWGQHELVDGRQVLIWHEGDWLEGRVRLLGDGRKVLPNPVVTVRRTRRSVQLTSDVRLRLRANDLT